MAKNVVLLGDSGGIDIDPEDNQGLSIEDAFQTYMPGDVLPIEAIRAQVQSPIDFQGINDSLRGEVGKGSFEDWQIQGGIDQVLALIERLSFDMRRCDYLVNGEEGLVRLSELVTDGETFASAISELFLSQWSSRFAHGSDMLLSMSALAGKLLADDEDFVGLRLAKWLKPVTCNVRLVAYDIGTGCEDGSVNPSVIMQLETSKGRIIEVKSEQIVDSPITRKAVNNPYIDGVVCKNPCCVVHRQGSNKLSFPLNYPTKPSFFDDFDALPELTVSTLIELLTYCVSVSRSYLGIGDTLGLMGAVQGLQLPELMKDIFNPGCSLDVEFLLDQQRLGKSGMILVPIRFKFPHQEEYGTGTVAFTNSGYVSHGIV